MSPHNVGSRPTSVADSTSTCRASVGMTSDLPTLLTRSQVAQILAVDVSTLSRWERAGVGPRCTWLTETTPRYDPADLATYINDRKSA